MTAGLHLHASTCNFMSKDRSGCSPRTVKPSRKSLRILCRAFISKIYGPLLSTGLEDEVLCSCSCTEILVSLTDSDTTRRCRLIQVKGVPLLVRACRSSDESFTNQTLIPPLSLNEPFSYLKIVFKLSSSSITSFNVLSVISSN